LSVAFGVFGGSFDPPHLAHGLFASYALAAFELERVLIVPTYAHAFGKPLSPFDDRLRMCELAFADLRRVEICSIERELPAPSLTLHTLEALSARYPSVQLRLLIGSDVSHETGAWHNFARIEELAPPLIIERQGNLRHAATSPALPDISSTEVRRRLREGEPTAGLLSPAVARYALSRGLYAGDR
jgi:nicotinate-nucleotide adenylyltransferase